MGKSQYNGKCLTEIKPSINNIKTKVWNVGSHLITTLGIQSQRNSETEASLAYRTTFKTARTTWTSTLFENLQTRRFKQQAAKLPYHRIAIIYTEPYVTLL